MISRDDVAIDGLPEIQFGSTPLAFKLTFDARKFRNCHELDVSIVDSSGVHVRHDVSRWGTKMRVTVHFDPQGAEGLVRLLVRSGAGGCEVARFWFVR